MATPIAGYQALAQARELEALQNTTVGGYMTLAKLGDEPEVNPHTPRGLLMEYMEGLALAHEDGMLILPQEMRDGVTALRKHVAFLKEAVETPILTDHQCVTYLIGKARAVLREHKQCLADGTPSPHEATLPDSVRVAIGMAQDEEDITNAAKALSRHPKFIEQNPIAPDYAAKIADRVKAEQAKASAQLEIYGAALTTAERIAAQLGIDVSQRGL